MDSLTAVKRPPTLIESWFNAMPPYLLRDILRLATDHQVIFLAAKTLLAHENTYANRVQVRRTQTRYNGRSLSDHLTVLLVQAGDKPITMAQVKSLKSTLRAERIHAAARLASGGDTMGLGLLKSNLSHPDSPGIEAAITFGRMARQKEIDTLKNLVREHPRWAHLKVALGEALFQKSYPQYYSRFLIMHRLAQAGYQANGLYESWFQACFVALESRVLPPSAFHAALVEMQKHPPFGADKEAVQRQLKTFIDFWDNTTTILAHSPEPPWPKTFAEALTNIKKSSSRNAPPDQRIAARISAAIAIIRSSGNQIGYENLSGPTPGLRALSPGGERALDGNLATSWQFAKQGQLVIEHPEKIRIGTIWIAQGCQDEKQPQANIRLTVSGTSPNKTRWTISHSINDTNRFFNKISVNQKSTDRITLVFESSKTGIPRCISEIRLSD